MEVNRYIIARKVKDYLDKKISKEELTDWTSDVIASPEYDELNDELNAAVIDLDNIEIEKLTHGDLVRMYLQLTKK